MRPSRQSSDSSPTEVSPPGDKAGGGERKCEVCVYVRTCVRTCVRPRMWVWVDVGVSGWVGKREREGEGVRVHRVIG